MLSALKFQIKKKNLLILCMLNLAWWPLAQAQSSEVFEHFDNESVKLSARLQESNTPEPDFLDRTDQNEISPRLIVEKNETMTFPKMVFSFGIYRDFLSDTTRENYSSTGLGVVFGFEQNIKGIWNGSIEARWSDWNSNADPLAIPLPPRSPTRNNTSPLSLFSKVSASPHLPAFFGNKTGRWIRPYATAGLGFTSFFDERALLSARSKTAAGQASITYGGGAKLVWPSAFALQLGVEWWRGVQTNEYAGFIYSLQLVLGDVDNI